MTRSTAHWSCSTGPERRQVAGQGRPAAGASSPRLGRSGRSSGGSPVGTGPSHSHASQMTQVVEPPSSRPGTGGVGAARRWRRRSRRCRSRTRSAPGREAGDIADVVGEDAGRAGAEMPKMSIRCQPESEYLLAQPPGRLSGFAASALQLADQVPASWRRVRPGNSRGHPVASRSRALQRWADFKAWTPRAAKSAGGIGQPQRGRVTVASGFGDLRLVRHGWGTPADLPCHVSGRVTAAGAWSRADTMRGGSDVGDEVRALP
jgi:hypothetical protein